MNRLCIYLTYDKQKIIDSYIGWMLRELKTCARRLVVVCNEREIVKGLADLTSYADQIFYRDNIGFDAGGFKDVLCRFLGWDEVETYEELILVNDSIYGPFCSMKEIFGQMDKKDVDFWGLARAEYGACKNNYGKDVPEHIQSYFLVVRKRMLHSSQFREYWEDMPYYGTFSDVFREYEFQFTRYFSNLGYTYDTLADTKINDSENIDHNYCQYASIPWELIQKRNFPFLKRQQMGFDTLEQHTQEQIRLAIDYIDKHTPYDVNHIWDNLIRTLNMADLQRNLCLRYAVTPEEDDKKYETAVIAAVFVRYEESVETIGEYLGNLPAGYEQRIISDSDQVAKACRRQGLACKKMSRGDEKELLEELAAYDLVCILHDTDMTSRERPNCIGKSYFYNLWENMLKDGGHVRGIRRRFLEEPRLGLLMPPQPNFAAYFGELGKGWNGEFERVKELAEVLGLNCQMDVLKPPFRVSEDVWVRGSILRRLKDMEPENYRLLPYLWSYLAQDGGFYSGIVESQEYAAMNEVNLQHYLSQLTGQVRRQYGGFETFFEMKKLIFMGALREFCAKHDRLMIYGTGYLARAYKDMMPGIEAFVVSDGREKEEELDGKPVLYLSEVGGADECGMVLCLDEKNQMEVIPLLEQHGIRDYLCI